MSKKTGKKRFCRYCQKDITVFWPKLQTVCDAEACREQMRLDHTKWVREKERRDRIERKKKMVRICPICQKELPKETSLSLKTHPECRPEYKAMMQRKHSQAAKERWAAKKEAKRRPKKNVWKKGREDKNWREIDKLKHCHSRAADKQPEFSVDAIPKAELRLMQAESRATRTESRIGSVLTRTGLRPTRDGRYGGYGGYVDGKREGEWCHDDYVKEQKELKKKNGRRCVVCGKALTGVHRIWCYKCHKAMNGVATTHRCDDGYSFSYTDVV